MFSWGTRSWNWEVTWQEPQELFRWRRNDIVFLLVWFRVEDVRTCSCSVTETKKKEEKKKNGFCEEEEEEEHRVVDSWSSTSRRHCRREVSCERVGEFVIILWKSLFLFLFVVDGKKRRLVNEFVDSKKYGQIEIERER